MVFHVGHCSALALVPIGAVADSRSLYGCGISDCSGGIESLGIATNVPVERFMSSQFVYMQNDTGSAIVDVILFCSN